MEGVEGPQGVGQGWRWKENWGGLWSCVRDWFSLCCHVLTQNPNESEISKREPGPPALSEYEVRIYFI